MGRPKNPFGDPVSVTTKGGYLKVRYYPSGMITEPQDRKWLAGKWCKTTERDLADQAASQLRAVLLDRRAAYGQGPLSEVTERVTVRLSVKALIESLENDDEVAPGTAAARKSQLNVNLVRNWGSYSVEQLGPLGPAIVGAVATATKTTRNGQVLKSSSTRSGALDALAVYGQWVNTTYRLPDPFGAHIATVRDTGGESRKNAIKRVHRENPFHDSNATSINPASVPALANVVGIRDGIIRRETGGSPSRPKTGRGSTGGTKPLTIEVATHSAEGVTFTASTGLRLCEMLVAHTSRIDADAGVIIVDRQLDRYKPWIPNEEPPMVPPKHNTDRTTQTFTSYTDKLKALVQYADEHNGGWLFPPTRGQKWWAEGYVHMVARAQLMLEDEHAAPDGNDHPVWRHHFHSLRHAYASHALAPVEAGGLGWSPSFVQECLGHQSLQTTETIYKHIIDAERNAARRVVHVWPGL